jgi:hypothetical protein
MPDLSRYSKVIEFRSKANADNYIGVGWELLETYTEPSPDEKGQTRTIYRVGWPRGAGDEPVEPPRAHDAEPQTKKP